MNIVRKYPSGNILCKSLGWCNGSTSETLWRPIWTTIAKTNVKSERPMPSVLKGFGMFSV